MKSQIIEKNGFLKPLGLILIIIVLSLTCFVNLVFANGPGTPEPGLFTQKTTVNAAEGVASDEAAVPYDIELQ